MTKGEEEKDFESTGGKRLNEDKESRPAKEVKLEGESSCDGTKEEEGEEEANDKVGRLRGLLAEDPKKLSEKDVEEVINCLAAEEIISLALEPRQGKGSDDDDGGMTKGEEEKDFESTGGKSLNEDKESRLAKKVKLEGESSGDGTKEEEGEEEANDKVRRLCGLLAVDPKKLSEKDVEEVINCLDAEEIISLALEPSQGKGSDDDDGENWKDGDEWCANGLDTVRLMVSCLDYVKVDDFRQAYEKWPPKAFAMVLSSALDLMALLGKLKDPLKYREYNDIIPKLCGVLPFKLFAHILKKTGVFAITRDY